MVKLFRTKHLFLTYRPLAFYTQYHETHACYMLQIALQVGVHIPKPHDYVRGHLELGCDEVMLFTLICFSDSNTVRY